VPHTTINSPLPGELILEVTVKEGDTVKSGHKTGCTGSHENGKQIEADQRPELYTSIKVSKGDLYWKVHP